MRCRTPPMFINAKVLTKIRSSKLQSTGKWPHTYSAVSYKLSFFLPKQRSHKFIPLTMMTTLISNPDRLYFFPIQHWTQKISVLNKFAKLVMTECYQPMAPKATKSNGWSSVLSWRLQNKSPGSLATESQLRKENVIHLLGRKNYILLLSGKWNLNSNLPYTNNLINFFNAVCSS